MMQPEASVESLLRSTLHLLEDIQGALTEGATDIAVSVSTLVSMHVMLQAAVDRLSALPDDPDAPARGVVFGSLIAGVLGGYSRVLGVLLLSSGKEACMISLAEQIAEAQRELALRKQCYPQWVKRGKLDAGDAKYQLRVMEAIVRTLMRLDAEQRQMSLF